ncbi:ABC-type multidrug transport system, ATPase component [Gottschalkia purinilytica]|uniref:ABC-type multidrug transport system, ATPase component n=1 Tax=Gottschalkia purinilytica TaxID=1503 RepID=A0A0L0WB53_GOTPU|nr:ABC transporter ATP-binding protein [Gottschalkia purinilytica]KNF08667.1 ABC-type multidrug transport system, ATPase component [Gottschalkia purinilytica]
MEPILEIKNLKKDFKDFSLKNINLTLERGYIMGFIGPNGSGKSTTIKLIMNLLKKDSGEIKVFGKDNIKHEQEIKSRIGFVYDENYFYEELTVIEMKKIVAPFYKKWSEDIFNKYVKEFELPLKRKIKDLSKGMKMKFSLAIALSHDAELLIMDEPTAGLDPIVRSELLDILYNIIQDENKSVFFSTHITSDLDKIADFVTMIYKGETIFCMQKDDILDSHRIIKGDKELLNEEITNKFIGLKENNYGFEALVKDKKWARDIFGDSIIIDKPNLEDIMVYYARRNKNA